MGLNEPWYVQLGQWSSRVSRGDLGYSWTKHQPVAEILKEALPPTLQLTLAALIINFFIGCIVGILSGIYYHRWFGKLLDIMSLSIYSIPVFWLALIAVLIFSLKLQWLPASGMSSFFIESAGFWSNLGDRLHHLALPAAVLGLTGAAATSRYVRGRMQEVLSQEYIRLAFAKGLSKRKVYLRHAFKNALIPVVTLLGLYFPALVGGAFVVEVIFAWPGIGRLTYEAVFARDYPVLMAVNFIVAVLVMLGNLISDLFYKFIEPGIQVK
jgi:peptide/nickel transport system permease protein